MSQLRPHIVIDLEATCWEKGTRPARMETIEIGAVKLVGSPLEVESEFSTFVRPFDEPELSEFCTGLTGIRQSDVDAAPLFPEALMQLVDWVDAEDVVLCSWGEYDRGQIEVDCKRHGIDVPAITRDHVNLKRRFAEQQNRKPCGMRHALRLLGLELEGAHHRGIDDARNIARIAAWSLERDSGGGA